MDNYKLTRTFLNYHNEFRIFFNENNIEMKSDFILAYCASNVPDYRMHAAREHAYTGDENKMVRRSILAVKSRVLAEDRLTNKITLEFVHNFE